MKFLFDTDHISILQHKTGQEFTILAKRMSQHSSSDIVFSIISYHEQLLGTHTFINRAKTTDKLIRGYARLEQIRLGFIIAPVLQFDKNAGDVFDDLQAQNIRVGKMDLRIAAIALSENLTLVTRNVRDFGKVPNLITEDWTV